MTSVEWKFQGVGSAEDILLPIDYGNFSFSDLVALPSKASSTISESPTELLNHHDHGKCITTVRNTAQAIVNNLIRTLNNSYVNVQ